MDQSEYAQSIINKYSNYLGNRKAKKTPLPSNVNERLAIEENLSDEEKQFVHNGNVCMHTRAGVDPGGVQRVGAWKTRQRINPTLCGQ